MEAKVFTRNLILFFNIKDILMFNLFRVLAIDCTDQSLSLCLNESQHMVKDK